MKNRIAGAISVLGLIVAVGCTPGADPVVDPLGEERVASVDGDPIQSTLFEFYSRGRLQKDVALLSDEEYDVLLTELIEFRILARAAEEEGLVNEEDVAAQLELQRLQSLARLVAANYLSANPATEAEVQIAYQANLPALSAPQYNARHILVEAQEEAQSIIEELQQGADFQELARTRSTGPSGPSGGDLGWFSADSMVAPFADAASTMEIGAFSEEPVQTEFGWHVILLVDATESEAPGLDAVRDEITSFVEQRKIQEYLDGLKEAAEVSIGGSAQGGAE